MLKHLAIVLMTLTLVGFYGNAQTNRAKQAQSDQKSPAPVTNAQVKQSEPPAPQPKSDEHIQADVRVIQAPPKGRYDKATFWISVILAGVGIAGIGVGIFTLLYLRRQTHAIEQQTRQLSSQTDFLVTKERARVSITFPEESEAMTVWPDKHPYAGSFRLNLKNTGASLAFDVVVLYDSFATDAEEAPQSADLFHLITPAFIEANSWQATDPLTIDLRFSGGEAPSVFYVYLRVLVTYKNIFQRESNRTKLLVRRQFMRTSPGQADSYVFWEAVGNPGDNEST